MWRISLCVHFVHFFHNVEKVGYKRSVFWAVILWGWVFLAVPETVEY